MKYIVFYFLFLCGCFAPELLPPTKPFILDKTTVSLDTNTKTLSGTGRVLFKQALFGLFSKEFYFFNAHFIDEDSFFILHSHFTGFAKEDGLQVFFKRTKNNLTIELSTPSYPPQTLYTQENYFLKNQVLKFYIEITNGSKNKVEIKIWDSTVNPTKYLKKEADFFSKENLMVDSQGLIFYSQGQGLLWGVELNKITLKEIKRKSIEQ